jgi:hypothetical protein
MLGKKGHHHYYNEFIWPVLKKMFLPCEDLAEGLKFFTRQLRTKFNNELHVGS